MAKNRETPWLEAWYGQRKWTFLLLPLMWLFRILSGLRRFWLTRFAQQRLSIPVIVVGNITLGGTGKTPLLIELVKHLQSRGHVPGVVSRGYGGRAQHYPLLVTVDSTALETGDEPLSIFRATGCAVCVGPDRVASGRLLQQQGCTIVLSDDGLQHYRLGRDVEIAVVDGQRAFGNGFCLPVGPLREPVTRLQSVDFVVINSASREPLPALSPATSTVPTFTMAVQAEHWLRVRDQQLLPLDYFEPAARVHAVCGIGNPRRFYQTLRELQLDPIEHDFPDHYAYHAGDFAFAEFLPVVMTAKDAVKCQAFAALDWYALSVRAALPEKFWQALDQRLTKINGT